MFIDIGQNRKISKQARGQDSHPCSHLRLPLCVTSHLLSTHLTKTISSPPLFFQFFLMIQIISLCCLRRDLHKNNLSGPIPELIGRYNYMWRLVSFSRSNHSWFLSRYRPSYCACWMGVVVEPPNAPFWLLCRDMSSNSLSGQIPKSFGLLDLFFMWVETCIVICVSWITQSL